MEVTSVSGEEKFSALFKESDRSSFHDVGETRTSLSDKSDEIKKRKVSKKKRAQILADVTGTKFSIVRTVCLEAGMKLTDGDNSECMFIWNDSPVPIDRIVELKLFQKINHFPGMAEICRKDTLARNMAKVQKECPEDFNFVPQTWVFPGEYALFQTHLRDLKKRKKNRTFIIKPSNGAMGNGIRLTRNAEKLQPHDNIIIQQYIEKPLLMDNFKFDLRIYVLVTSCDPLKIFLYNEGLVRMGTMEYSAPTDSNLDCHFMHLTNYSVNKFNDAFVKTTEENKGSKRTLKFLFEWLKAQDRDTSTLWSNIQDVIVKTILVALPHVHRAYHVCRPSDPACSESVCFEILGFDILLDKKLKPWVLECLLQTAECSMSLRQSECKNSKREVNRAPSFGTDQALDYRIKKGMLKDAIKILNIRIGDKKRGIAQEKREAQKRLLKKVKKTDSIDMQPNRRTILEQKRNELKIRLMEIRKESAREEYENQNMGEFKRIYPSDDKFKSSKYKSIFECTAKVFTGRPYLQRETAKQFQDLQEDEVLELLEQAEMGDSDVLLDDVSKLSLLPRRPKPLRSMPSAKSVPTFETRSESKLSKRPFSSKTDRIKPEVTRNQEKYKTISKTMSMPSFESHCTKEDVSVKVNFNENIEELTKDSLDALNNMRIKFPGKTDEEAAILLNSILENWKYHKPKVASYWLVKLDSVKRRKVIDIVKGNVRAILEKIWKTEEVDSLRLGRMFTKIFNRFLSNHGQGLWNCFNTSTSDSWENIISKSIESVTMIEIACCRRVVQLCQDCLLVVYEFASQAESASIDSPQHSSLYTRADTFSREPSYVFGDTSTYRKLSLNQRQGAMEGDVAISMDVANCDLPLSTIDDTVSSDTGQQSRLSRQSQRL